jgi:hypothetical protein
VHYTIFFREFVQTAKRAVEEVQISGGRQFLPKRLGPRRKIAGQGILVGLIVDAYFRTRPVPDEMSMKGRLRHFVLDVRLSSDSFVSEEFAQLIETTQRMEGISQMIPRSLVERQNN